MGIQYSPRARFTTGIRSNTMADLLGDLDGFLEAAGWRVRSAVTGGLLYTIESPQEFRCKVRIWDEGEPNLISIQFQSEDGLKLGRKHRLTYGISAYYDLGYQIQANQCQFFTAIPGISTEQLVVGRFQHSVSGGIPYVGASIDPQCTAETIPGLTTRIFWSCGTGADAFTISPNFRTSRYCFQDYTTLWNDTLYNSSPSQSVNPSLGGQLSLFPLTPTINIDHGSFFAPHIVKYGSLDPLHLDALIGWDWNIRGQVWDAFMVSRDTTLDEKVTVTQIDDQGNQRKDKWIGWNYLVPGDGQGGGGTWLSTLYLLMGDSYSEGHNVAY